MATVLSAEPVARMYSLKGLKARQLTSAWWASTTCWALEVLSVRVSQLGKVEEGKGRKRQGGGGSTQHSYLIQHNTSTIPKFIHSSLRIP